jgi:flagellar biosynthesis regulator FlbT
MLMDPSSARTTAQLAQSLIDKANEAFESAPIKHGLEAVAELIGRARYFEAMKALRAMYPLEQSEMFPGEKPPTSYAA